MTPQWLLDAANTYREQIGSPPRIGRRPVERLTGLSKRRAQVLVDHLRNEALAAGKEPLDIRSGSKPLPASEPQPPAPRLERSEAYNAATVTLEDDLIRTEADLVRMGQVDLETYFVDRLDQGAWTTPLKLRTFEFGKIKSEEVVHKQNFKITAFLKRRELTKQKFPAVQPLSVSVSAPPKPRVARTGTLARALIIPDSQNGYRRDARTGVLEPFHDRRCWDLAVQLAGVLQPDEIVYLGDMLDLPDWSDKFIRSPDMYFTTQPTATELAWWFGRVRAAAPHARTRYLKGNHEARFDRALLTHLLAAHDLKPADEVEGPGLLSVPRLLGLESLGVEYIDDYPDGEVWLNDAVMCVHGTQAKNSSGETTRALLGKALVTEVQGHIHRFEQSCSTLHGRYGVEIRQACSPGTLARIDGAVPGTSRKQNWQNGVAVLSYEPEGTYHDIQMLLIRDGQLTLNGTRFSGSDDVTQLCDETGWDFRSERRAA